MKPIPDHVREAFPFQHDGRFSSVESIVTAQATRLAEAVRAECVALLREAREMLRGHGHCWEDTCNQRCGACGGSEPEHRIACPYTALLARIDAAVGGA